MQPSEVKMVQTEQSMKKAIEHSMKDLSILSSRTIDKSDDYFQIKSNPNKGRFAVASKILKPGQLILKETPVVFVADAVEYNKRCFSCFRCSTEKSEQGKISDFGPQITVFSECLSLSRCSKCKLAWYCSKDCQLRDWAVYHKKECVSYAKHKESVPTSIRLMTKILILSQGAYPSFMSDMISNRQQFSLQEVKKFGEMSLLLHNFIDHSQLTAIQLIDLWCKLQCNGFSICDDELSKVGVGLYEKAACFNHSCRPNAYAYFNGHNLELRALDTIDAEQEITITYIETFEPQTVRKKNLKEQYFFDCLCDKCCQDESKPTTRSDYLPCPVCMQALFINEFNFHAKDNGSCTCSLEHTFHELKLAYKAFKSLTVSPVKSQTAKPIDEQIKSLKAIEKTFQKHLVPTSHYFTLQLSHSLIGSLSRSIFLLLDLSNIPEACKTYTELTRYVKSYIEALICAGASKFHPFISNTYFTQSITCFQIWDLLAHNHQKGPLCELLQDYSEKLSIALNTSLSNANATHGQQSSTYIQLSQFKMSLTTFLAQK
ncbi:SET and MYND domain-containing protein 3 [Entomophthora muscae]|uniref:SET and MYND domain-containing protein 3 n=2 Tax=Entomophthora muscae TaxID=34485 RepID=A0ACC2UI44_9FUNG|nr:SET and MYND domain-containing protein 3 [Entomophthora muscae]